MKLRDIFSTANANLLRNKIRTFLTIIAIFIGVLVISLTSAINAGVNQYITAQIGTLGGDNILFITPKAEEQTDGPQLYDSSQSNNSSSGMLRSRQQISPIKPADIAKIEAIQNVKNAQPLQSLNTVYIQYNEGSKYQLTASEQFDGIKNDVLAGSDQVLDGDYILLAYDYFNVLGFNSPEDCIGKTVTIAVQNKADDSIKEFEAPVQAVLNKSLLQGGSTILSESLTEKVVTFQNKGIPDNLKNNYQFVYASLDTGLSESAKDDAKNQITSLGFTVQDIADALGEIMSVIDAITYVLMAFAAIALLAASFGIVNTLYMAVSERTKEIGLMKAMGMSRAKVFLLFSTEAVLIGFWGSIFGVLVSFGLGKTINEVASQTFLKELTGFNLMAYPWQNTVIVVGVIILIAFIAGTLPSIKASNKNPINALSYE